MTGLVRFISVASGQLYIFLFQTYSAWPHCRIPGKAMQMSTISFIHTVSCFIMLSKQLSCDKQTSRRINHRIHTSHLFDLQCLSGASLATAFVGSSSFHKRLVSFFLWLCLMVLCVIALYCYSSTPQNQLISAALSWIHIIPLPVLFGRRKYW